MEDHLLKISEEYKKQILNILKNDDIYNLLNSKGFYYDKAIDVYQEFMNMEVKSNTSPIFKDQKGQSINLPFYDAAIEKVKQFYSKKTNKTFGDFLNSIGSSPDSEMLKKAAELVAYSDYHAWNKNELNKYPDKRVVAKSHVRQPIWIIGFIEFKKSGDFSKINSPNVLNAIKFYESPYKKSNILSKSHRKLIFQNFLQLEYEPDNFEEVLNTFFHFYDDLKFQNSDNRQPLYTKILYSKAIRQIWDKSFKGKSDKEEQEEEGIDILENHINSDKFKHDSDIITDGIAEEDLLNRKALMEVIHEKIKNFWADTKQLDSFTLLINGPWGSGKSSMLYYLKEFLTKDDNWNVIEYNAWKNQRFDNPWWILVNKVSETVPIEATSSNNDYRSRSHWYWKNISQNAIKYKVALVLAIIFIIGFVNNWLGEPDTLSYLTSLLGLIISAFLAVQGIVKHLFKKQALHELQIENAGDPLEVYKKRFESVVKHKKVAIFIDDLDRCEVDPTIKLLEGVQTLFKGSKVLYVMAADGQWLVNCFDKKYEDFESITADGQTIGNQFLQKTFQLMVDVPKLNKEQMQKFLNTTLGVENNLNSSIKIDQPKYREEDIEEANTSDKLREISGATGTSSETKRLASIKLEKTVEKEKGQLEPYIINFHKENYLPLNPRQIKRIINLYAMKSQEFAISGVTSDITQEMIMKYIIFSTEYPEYNTLIKQEKFEDKSENPNEVLELIHPLTPNIIREYF